MVSWSDSDDEISNFLSRTTKRCPDDIADVQSADSDSKLSLPAPHLTSSVFDWPDTRQGDTERSKRKRLCQSGVDWPIPFQGRKISFGGETRSRAAFQAMDWYYHVLDRYLEAGYSNDSLVTLFRSIPDELAGALKEGLGAFQVLRASMNTTLRCPMQSPDDPEPAASSNFLGFNGDDIPRDDDGGGSELESEVWDEQDDCGLLRFEWDAATQVSCCKLPPCPPSSRSNSTEAMPALKGRPV